MKKVNRNSHRKMNRARVETKPRTPSAINQKPIKPPGPIPQSNDPDALKAWHAEAWQYTKEMVRAGRGEECTTWIEKQDCDLNPELAPAQVPLQQPVKEERMTPQEYAEMLWEMYGPSSLCDED